MKKAEPLGEDFSLAVSCYSGRLWPKHIGMLVPVCLIRRLGCAQKPGAISQRCFATVISRYFAPDHSQVRELSGQLHHVPLILSALT